MSAPAGEQRLLLFETVCELLEPLFFWVGDKTSAQPVEHRFLSR